MSWHDLAGQQLKPKTEQKMMMKKMRRARRTRRTWKVGTRKNC